MHSCFSIFPPFAVRLLVALVLLTTSVPMRSDVTAPAAEEPWQQLKALQKELATDAPKGVNEVEHFAPVKARLHEAAKEFAVTFRDDPRRWEAELIVVKTTIFPVPAQERKEIFRANEEIVASVVSAKDAAAEVRQNAVRTILFQHLDHLDLLASPQEADGLEKRVLAYLRDYPEDPKAPNLQIRRLDVLAKSDPSKVRPLLEELSTSSIPKIAAAARGRIALLALSEAPLDWKFTALDGRQVDLAQLRGHVILVDYWASWCPDCLRALPQVLAAHQKYHDRGFEVIGVSLDTDQQALAATLKKRGMTWPEYYDGKAWQSEIVTKYGVSGIPAMWLVGKDGRVVAAGVEADELDSKVARLLGE